MTPMRRGARLGGAMGEDGEAPAMTRRIVLELSSEGETVSGTVTTAEESRTFWGWLELMSALELATGAGTGEFVPSGTEI